MDILIHASRERNWYVQGYLIPKLLSTKLRVFYDAYHQGNIEAYLRSYEKLPLTGDTWHLEDDVLPDKRFLKWAEELEDFEGIVCGFGASEESFYSFPCIRIPNWYIQTFLIWLKHTDDECVKARFELGKGIDFIFRKYWIGHQIPVKFMNPCMVEHIDDLIGGSLINIREKPLKAYRFEDEESLTDLKRWLGRREDGAEKTRRESGSGDTASVDGESR